MHKIVEILLAVFREFFVGLWVVHDKIVATRWTTVGNEYPAVDDGVRHCTARRL